MFVVEKLERKGGGQKRSKLREHQVIIVHFKSGPNSASGAAYEPTMKLNIPRKNWIAQPQKLRRMTKPYCSERIEFHSRENSVPTETVFQPTIMNFPEDQQ